MSPEQFPDHGEAQAAEYWRQEAAIWKYAALHDEATGLPNRRGVFESIRQEPLVAGDVVIILDVNKLKGVNDNLGHEAGDRALKKMAARIDESVRSYDIASRWGGDEFVVAIREKSAPPEEALIRAIYEQRHPSDGQDSNLELGRFLRRLNKGHEEDLINDEHGIVLKNLGYGITAGIAIVKQTVSDKDAFEAIVKEADRDLYSKKPKNPRS